MAGTDGLGLAFYLGIVGVGELSAWVPGTWWARLGAGRSGPVETGRTPEDRPSLLDDPESLVVDWGEMAAGDVIQQQVRSRSPDGTELLRGWLRVPLVPGQRSASVHVAFCPPFGRAPRVEVEQRAGPSARIKSAQLLPHGARFDLKLAQPSESAGFILVEFSAEEGKEPA